MNNEVLVIKHINVKNCFLHVSSQRFRSLISPTVCGLKLTTNNGNDLYFSPNSVPSPLVDGNFIGISNTFANILGLQENEHVIISPLYNLGSLQSICVTPKSENDFEILNSSALTIETSLLNQLRVVWPKQSFPIWVTANISVTLVVDSVTPNLKYGRLEKYSEVVVATVLPKNGIREKNNAINDIPLNTLNLREELIQPRRLKFRCVIQEDFFSQKFKLHPYVVFVHKKCLPDWAIDVIELNKKNVFRLMKFENHLKDCVVNVVICEKACEHDKLPYKTLFISPLLAKYFDLELGEKILLESINSNNTGDISGVMVSLLNDDVETVVDEIHDTFFQAITSQGDLLLNTKAPYLLKNLSEVLLTLRPLDATWGFLSLNNLGWLSISLNKFVSETSVTIKKPGVSCIFDNFIPSFNNILEESKITLELSVGLHPFSRIKLFNDNILFTGKNGCGKTRLVKCLLDRLKKPPFYIYTKYINCCSLKGKRIETLSKYFNEILEKCSLCEPSVLVLDDVDLLVCTPEENTEAAFHINRVSHKIVELIEGYQRKHSILLVSTAVSFENFNSRVFSNKGKSLFTTLIKIPSLNKEDRMVFMKKYVESKFSFTEENIDYNEISSRTEGYTPLDLQKLCDKAIFEAWQRKALDLDNISIKNEDFEQALRDFMPSALHQVNFYKGTKTNWKDVGGLQKVKEKLIEVVCWSTMYPDIINQCPVKPQTGVLIYGAPGTGKTLLASALAGESRMNFISIKGPELMSKYIGESEEGVRKLFEKAQAAQPCLLFFDEFDSLAPRRGQDQTGVTDRVVNQLLTALDGVDPMSGVWVLAATSRPDLIDPAVLRPGRIGISVHCDLPDKEEREEIIKSICLKTSLSEDIDVKEISELTEGFTGADIKGLFTSAQIKAIDILQDEGDILNSELDLENDSLPVIKLQKEHIFSVLTELKPSLSESERQRYQAIYSQFQHRTPVKIMDQKVTHA